MTALQVALREVVCPPQLLLVCKRTQHVTCKCDVVHARRGFVKRVPSAAKHTEGHQLRCVALILLTVIIISSFFLFVIIVNRFLFFSFPFLPGVLCITNQQLQQSPRAESNAQQEASAPRDTHVKCVHLCTHVYKHSQSHTGMYNTWYRIFLQRTLTAERPVCPGCNVQKAGEMDVKQGPTTADAS